MLAEHPLLTVPFGAAGRAQLPALPLAGSFGAETRGDPSGISYRAVSMTTPDITIVFLGR